MEITFKDAQLWALSQATPEELDQLQESIRMRRSNMFGFGQRVWFDAKTRGIIHGKITKIKQKNVEVTSDSGVRWNVTPMVLHHEKQATLPATTPVPPTGG